LRRELLPSLPGETRLVTASRQRLPSKWRTAPGWTDLIEAIALGGLDPKDVREYLERNDVPAERHEDIVDFADGHPLSLVVAASAIRRAPDLELAPAAGIDALEPVLQSIFENVSGPTQRDILAAAVLVRRLREPLLAYLLGRQSASDEMRWLATLPFMRGDDHGLYPHPVARRLILNELLSTDGGRVERLTQRGQEYYASNTFARSTEETRRLLFDSQYLARIQRPINEWQVIEHPFDVSRADGSQIDRCRRAVQEFEGESGKEAFDFWHARQAEGLRVVSDHHGDPAGFVFFLDLDCADPAIRSHDPIVEALCEQLDEPPNLADDVVRLCRFWGGFDRYQRGSPVRPQLFADIATHVVMPSVAVGGAVHLDADYWRGRDDNVLNELASVELPGGNDAVILGHDWREYDRSRWFRDKMHLFTGQVSKSQTAPPDIDIEDAVRDALKNFHRGDALLDNPLSKTEPVRRRCVDTGRPEAVEQAVRTLIRDACQSLGTGGDDAMHRDILERTYLCEQPEKQAAVAADMNMAYSTFRKHLSEATDRVVGRIRRWV
jgi:hypothetical protein